MIPLPVLAFGPMVVEEVLEMGICDSCEDEVLEDELEYIETVPMTWEEPADGVSLCSRCVASREDAEVEYLLAQREAKLEDSYYDYGF